MSLHCVKSCPISVSIMCMSIVVPESWRYPVLTRFAFRSIRQRRTTDSMSKCDYRIFTIFVLIICCGFSNVATSWRGRATVVAGTAGQQYVDNIFYNPDNDYEMITVNRSM